MKYFYKDDSFDHLSIDLAVLHEMHKNLNDFFIENKNCGIKNIFFSLNADSIHFAVTFEIPSFDVTFLQFDFTSSYSRKGASEKAKKLIDLYNSIIDDKIALCPQPTTTEE